METFQARVVAAALLTIASGITLSACGSGSSIKETSSTAGTSGSKTDTVAGIRSLEELYKGTEAPPPSEGPAAVKGKSIVWISCGQVAEGCAAPAAAAAEAAKDLGWKFKLLDAKLGAGGAFGAAIRQAIVLKPDAIVTVAINCDAAQQPLQEAKQAGIPVLGVLNNDCDAKGGPKLQPIPMMLNDTSPTTKDFWTNYGAQKAAYIIHKTNAEAKIINMWLSDSLTEINDGFTSTLKKCQGCQVVADLPMLAPEQAPGGPLPQRFTTALARHPDANAFAITADSPLVGSGLASKMNSMPTAKKLISVAGEGSGYGMDLLRKPAGVPTAENGYDNEWLGYAAMDSLNRFFAKTPAVPEGIGSRIVDREHHMTAKGPYSSPIDFKPAFRKVWSGASN
ncbi:ABC-type sugar transport system%2C periplasmic component [Mycobacterium tuberculosis]|nr:ABC-type sugar transport system%2C periplasmic component [Mycobacterium tuberculosis]